VRREALHQHRWPESLTTVGGASDDYPGRWPAGDPCVAAQRHFALVRIALRDLITVQVPGDIDVAVGSSLRLIDGHPWLVAERDVGIVDEDRHGAAQQAAPFREGGDDQRAANVDAAAARRVEDMDGRNVYDSDGTLQPHFVGLDDALKARLEKGGGGRVIYSLANGLRMRRPVVIMDERAAETFTAPADPIERLQIHDR